MLVCSTKCYGAVLLDAGLCYEELRDAIEDHAEWKCYAECLRMLAYTASTLNAALCYVRLLEQIEK